MNIKQILIQILSRVLVKEKIRLGDNTYIRRRFLRNQLEKTLEHEAFLDDIFAAALNNKEGTVIDVGVNTGQTLFKVLSIDKDRPYLGFEPQITPASCVEHFLVENNIKHHCIMPIALSDRNGSIPINIRGDGIFSMASALASMVDGFRPKDFYSHSKHIYAARGDDVIQELGISSISLIKIDVEGAELEVMRGLKTTIEKHRPFLIFEVLHHYLAVTDEALDKETIGFRESRIQELEEIIRSNNYRIYQVIGNNEITKVEKIKPRMVNNLESTDYIAVPDENDNKFRDSLKSGRRVTAD